jgi:hypothetical protein
MKLSDCRRLATAIAARPMTPAEAVALVDRVHSMRAAGASTQAITDMLTDAVGSTTATQVQACA